MFVFVQTDRKGDCDALVVDFEKGDTRQWTQQHLEAANVPNPCCALTPPQGEDQIDTKDVDVRGPGNTQAYQTSQFNPFLVYKTNICISCCFTGTIFVYLFSLTLVVRFTNDFT